jgi:DivIVA domain-containing protein
MSVARGTIGATQLGTAFGFGGFGTGEKHVFWFLLIAMVVVVAAVTMAVLGGGGRSVLPETAPAHLVDPLPETRPVSAADIDAVRLPVTVRGYRMSDVDDVLSRLGAELTERDARITELETALAGARTGGAPSLQAYGQQAPHQPRQGRPEEQPYEPYEEEPYQQQYGQQPYDRPPVQGWGPQQYPPPSGQGDVPGPVDSGPAAGEEGGR